MRQWLGIVMVFQERSSEYGSKLYRCPKITTVREVSSLYRDLSQSSTHSQHLAASIARTEEPASTDSMRDNAQRLPISSI